MKKLAAQIVAQMKPYFDSLLRIDPETGELYIEDDELGARASCCTTGLAASLYILDGQLSSREESFKIAKLLAEDVKRRQLPSGAFGQPFYVKHGDPETVDIAEIGAVANSLYHIYKATGSLAARESLLESAEYLLTQAAPQNPGVILKRPGETFDVLNGDMYAANTFGRAYELSGKLVFLEKMIEIFDHLADRFGKNVEGWWPYIEDWNGAIVMGNSVLYQATILALADTAIPLLPDKLKEEWESISIQAMHTILQAIKEAPNEQTEEPWWSRDWRNGWELYAAFIRSPYSEEVRQKGIDRFQEVESDLREVGYELFRPVIVNDVPDRTPVTTTFRKAAGFAGLIVSVVLDEELRISEKQADDGLGAVENRAN